MVFKHNLEGLTPHKTETSIVRYGWPLPKHRTYWPEEEHARLAELVAAGTPPLEIAKVLGRSLESVTARGS